MPAMDILLACTTCAALLVFDGYMIRRVRAEIRTPSGR